MQDNDKNFQKWLQKAEEDEYVGKLILDEKVFLNSACFHFQQMTEKLLKALLIFYKKDYPYSHDLIAIGGFLKSFLSEIEEHRNDLELLNRYYVETRYPGDYPEFSLQEAKQALEAALRIKDFVLSKLRK